LFPEGFEDVIEKASKVFFLVKNDNDNFVKIELSKNYLLDNSDIDKIESIVGIAKVTYS